MHAVRKGYERTNLLCDGHLLDLDCDLLTIERRAVHLRNTCGGDRHVLERVKKVVRGRAVELFREYLATR